MIFNENGFTLPINNVITINENKIDLASLLEDVMNDPKHEKLIKELKDEIRSSDDKYIDKLNTAEKVKLLSKKERKIKAIWSAIIGLSGAIPSMIAVGVGSGMVDTGSTGAGFALMGVGLAVMLIMGGIAMKLLNDLDKDKEKKIAQDLKIVEIVKEIIMFLEKQAMDERLPRKLREDAYDRVQRLKEKIEKVKQNITDDRVQSAINAAAASSTYVYVRC